MKKDYEKPVLVEYEDLNKLTSNDVISVIRED
jgi:hypothetical protein